MPQKKRRRLFQRDLRLVLVFAALPLIDCQGPAEPTAPTPSATPGTPPAPMPPTASSTWSADSTLLAVSATRNSCLTDGAIGDTRTNVGWTIKQDATSITLIETIGPVDLRTPYYTGSLNDRSFTATTWQDGGYDCFVWEGDVSGSFSADGLTFDAIETIEYHHFGENPMQVRRHWTGRQR
jgi:hypothetical protein